MYQQLPRHAASEAFICGSIWLVCVFHLHSPFFGLVDYRRWQNASPFIQYESTLDAIQQKVLRLFGGDDSESRMTFFKEAVHAFSGDGHRVFMMDYDLTAPNNPV